MEIYQLILKIIENPNVKRHYNEFSLYLEKTGRINEFNAFKDLIKIKYASNSNNIETE
mgnify:CR=1 FL=1